MFQNLHLAHGFADLDEFYAVHARAKDILSVVAPRVTSHGAMMVTLSVDRLSVSTCKRVDFM